MKRRSMSAGKDKRVFAQTSNKTKKINTITPQFRGGIRL